MMLWFCLLLLLFFGNFIWEDRDGRRAGAYGIPGVDSTLVSMLKQRQRLRLFHNPILPFGWSVAHSTQNDFWDLEARLAQAAGTVSRCPISTWRVLKRWKGSHLTYSIFFCSAIFIIFETFSQGIFLCKDLQLWEIIVPVKYYRKAGWRLQSVKCCSSEPLIVPLILGFYLHIYRDP